MPAQAAGYHAAGFGGEIRLGIPGPVAVGVDGLDDQVAQRTGGVRADGGLVVVLGHLGHVLLIVGLLEVGSGQQVDFKDRIQPPGKGRAKYLLRLGR